MRINHNIAALNTYRMLGQNSTSASKSLEKLSSGLRINRAGDDAAGLAISEKMRAQIRGLSMASKNSQDAISLIQTAEGALNETHSILQRMRELAVQAASDTNVTADREEIQKEINQLTSEVNRIANTTEFNTMKLLNGDKADAIKTIKAVTKQYDAPVEGLTVANGAIDIASISLASAADAEWSTTDSGAYISISKNTAGKLEVVLSAAFLSGAGNISGISITDEIAVSFDSNGNYTYNSHGVTFTFSKEAWDNALAGAAIVMDPYVAAPDGTAWANASGTYTINKDVTFSGAPGVSLTGVDVASSIEFEVATMSASIAAGNLTVNFMDKDGNVIITDNVLFSGGSLSGTLAYNNHGVSFTLTGASAGIAISGSFTVDFDIAYSDRTVNNALAFQVGSNENQTMSLSVSDMTAKALGLSTDIDDTDGYGEAMSVSNGTDNTSIEFALDVTSQANAANAVTAIDDALKNVSSERAKLGAIQNRLEHTIANLDTSAENLTASESRIRDVDMAKEMMEFTKNNILLQAGQAMLAQANQQPQGVLQLLR
ncbi:MAG: flagellin [Thermincola sp.]|jgi:flagellin|nr:flagellin [Thermincola sp.]MDT3703383.1 flagellin [Thermincola sp.]